MHFFLYFHYYVDISLPNLIKWWENSDILQWDSFESHKD